MENTRTTWRPMCQGQDQGSGWRTHGPHGDLCAIAALLLLLLGAFRQIAPTTKGD
ncbi:hypothetical protein J4Q44_G00387090 [Coregonus suidteri]|uniref:Uncharacterized protein n=1 Tax=Coregonus suidteri TaxID=861788 RepID=A0AAN8KQS6_9TELE